MTGDGFIYAACLDKLEINVLENSDLLHVLVDCLVDQMKTPCDYATSSLDI